MAGDSLPGLFLFLTVRSRPLHFASVGDMLCGAMTEAEKQAEVTTPTPGRSRRMIVWLVALPAVLLLLALAGANWKVFHLAYCRRLIRSSDASDQRKGAYMVIDTHVRNGMPLQEVRELLRPAELVKAHTEDRTYPRGWSVVVVGEGYKINPLCTLYFDEQGRLIFKPVD